MAAGTIDEVAKVAGVSKSTVSRVINQSPRVAPEVARKVNKAIVRMGYHPSPRRPGPKPSTRSHIRTGKVLLLVVGYGIERIGGYPGLMSGIENAIHENGLQLALASLDAGERLPMALNPKEVDGVLLFGKPEALTQAAQSAMGDVPTVGLMRGFDEFQGRIDRVVFDNALVGPMAARYLADHGHRRVVYFNSDPAHPAIIVRQRDFIATAAESGMEVFPIISEFRPEGHQQPAVYGAMTDRLLALSPDVTGICVAIGDQMGWLYGSLEARGIPLRRFDVICADDLPSYLDPHFPKPAAININLELVGYRGVQQLLWRMANRDVKNRMKLAVEPVLVAGD